MALREDQKALAGLIRRGLSGDVKMATPDCPGPDELAAYYEKSLPSAEAARWETHFSNCAHCRMQLAAIARAGEADAQPQHGPWVWGLMWNWRWLVPAATALAVLVVWFALRPTRGILQHPANGRTEVAMNAPPVVSAPASPTAEKPASAGSSSTSSPPTAESRESVAGATKSLPAGAFAKKPLAAPQAGIPRGASKPALALPPAPAPPPEAKTELAEKAKEESSPAAAMDQMVEVAPAPAANPQNATGDLGRAAQGSKDAAASDERKSRAAGALARNALRASPAQLQTLGVRSGEAFISDPEKTILWRVGPAGSIERSDNAGLSWQQQLSRISEDLLAGSAPSAKTCWVVGRAGVVLRTTDGQTWRQLASPTAADLVGVQAQDARQATVKTADGRSFVTADGGKTWQPKD
ncbi:MAG: YCF48-related protein [Candidatus Acidiferrales bacterium]